MKIDIQLNRSGHGEDILCVFLGFWRHLHHFSRGLNIASNRYAVVNDCDFNFLVLDPFPLGKNENKWHKSAFYIPGRNSTIDYL